MVLLNSDQLRLPRLIGSRLASTAGPFTEGDRRGRRACSPSAVSIPPQSPRGVCRPGHVARGGATLGQGQGQGPGGNNGEAGVGARGTKTAQNQRHALLRGKACAQGPNSANAFLTRPETSQARTVLTSDGSAWQLTTQVTRNPQCGQRRQQTGRSPASQAKETHFRTKLRGWGSWEPLSRGPPRADHCLVLSMETGR